MRLFSTRPEIRKDCGEQIIKPGEERRRGRCRSVGARLALRHHRIVPTGVSLWRAERAFLGTRRSEVAGKEVASPNRCTDPGPSLSCTAIAAIAITATQRGQSQHRSENLPKPSSFSCLAHRAAAGNEHLATNERLSRYRQWLGANGESRRLYEAPGHQFEPHQGRALFAGS